MFDRIRTFGYSVMVRLTYWDDLFLGIVSLLWRNRKNVIPTLLAAESLAIAMSKADGRDLADIHTHDPRVYHAAYAVACAVTGTRPEPKGDEECSTMWV